MYCGYDHVVQVLRYGQEVLLEGAVRIKENDQRDSFTPATLWVLIDWCILADNVDLSNTRSLGFAHSLRCACRLDLIQCVPGDNVHLFVLDFQDGITEVVTLSVDSEAQCADWVSLFAKAQSDLNSLPQTPRRTRA